ncbi:MAG: hypothetical protein D6B27_11595, partial [Gammaproteobacteria bacterium]
RKVFDGKVSRRDAFLYMASLSASFIEDDIFGGSFVTVDPSDEESLHPVVKNKIEISTVSVSFLSIISP